MNNIVPRPAPALALGETLLKLLADKDIPAEKLQIMLQMQKDIMAEHGSSLTFYQRIENGKAIMVGKLMHRSDHFELSEKIINPDPGPGRNAAQAEGSGTTYAKRYLGEGLLNIIRHGVDDDGILAGLKPIDDSQLKELTKLLKETGSDHAIFLNMMISGVTELKDIPARDFPRLVNALQQKKEAQARLPREPKK